MILKLRKDFKKNPNDIEKALSLAEALRMRDYNIHDGGSAQREGINTYKHVLHLMSQLNYPPSTQRDSFLCGIYVNLGKMYFVANMFDRALESFNSCLDIDNNKELGALAQKGAVLYILGRFKESADTYVHLLNIDEQRWSGELYTGLSKVLVANESAVDGGWDVLINVIQKEIPRVTKLISDDNHNNKSNNNNPEEEQMMYDNLKRMHLAMF